MHTDRILVHAKGAAAISACLISGSPSKAADVLTLARTSQLSHSGGEAFCQVKARTPCYVLYDLGGPFDARMWPGAARHKRREGDLQRQATDDNAAVLSRAGAAEDDDSQTSWYCCYCVMHNGAVLAVSKLCDICYLSGTLVQVWS
ncbi:hypothetical protein DER45DRAFT_539263 [Fusarium avenaceum]|nr:hypothetical protein DER45DRAFT_539263 [Fusarium avenaceum]